MATYETNLITNRNRHRGMYSGRTYDITGRLALPTGTVIAVGDVFLFAPIGENQIVAKVKGRTVGDSGVLEVSLGYHQILDTFGDPIVVERNGPRVDIGPFGFPSKFPSPATDADFFLGSWVTANPMEELTETTVKLPGPVYFSATVTVGLTLTEDIELYVGAVFDGEDSVHQVTDPNSDNTYLLG